MKTNTPQLAATMASMCLLVAACGWLHDGPGASDGAVRRELDAAQREELMR